MKYSMTRQSKFPSFCKIFSQNLCWNFFFFYHLTFFKNLWLIRAIKYKHLANLLVIDEEFVFQKVLKNFRSIFLTKHKKIFFTQSQVCTFHLKASLWYKVEVKEENTNETVLNLSNFREIKELICFRGLKSKTKKRSEKVKPTIVIIHYNSKGRKH